MALTSGTKIGPYEILSLLGAGGMGEVYRARDSRLRREVAIKILPASFAQETERLRRFEQEARAVGALNHPNILAIFDVGTQDGSPYLVSELLEGQSLRQHMQGAPLSQRKAVDYGMQIARGLAAAHEKGVVHRDLKPDNIFVLNDGRIKILDFGLAKLQQGDMFASGTPDLQTVDHPQSNTTPGQVVGTVGYMSPEQVRGQATDHRTDIFAFGAILYEMLSGQRAFKRDSSVETMNAILKEEPPELEEVTPNLSPGLDRVVRHCLEKNPAQRFQSASDIAFDLETISSHSATGSRLKAVAAERRAYWKQAVAALVVVAALALTYYAARSSAPPLTPRFHQLTFQRGTIYGARFAPDGQSILFSAAWNGAPKEQVYTTRTDALMSRPIDLMDSEVLSISSKGEMAIRQATQRGQVPRGMLSVVPLTGGAPRELLGDVIDAAWGPGGDTLAAVHVVSGENRLEYPIGKTILTTSTGNITNVAVSPDGKWIAYFDHPQNGDTRGYVAVTDLAGKAKRLTKEWSDLTGLAWSRSGDEVWFTGSDAGINSALYAVDLNGKLRDLLHIPGRLHLFDISKDGQVLITNEATRLEAYGHRAGQAKDIDLSWFDWTIARSVSNDGQWAVLEEDGEGGGPQYSIFLRKTDGSPAIRLGSGMGLDISPDTQWVASTGVKQPAPTVLLPSGAGQPLTLGDGGLFHSQSLRFLPDGKGVIMVAAEAGHAPRTYVQMLDGSAPRALGPEDFRGTLVSPEGKSVLGYKDRAAWIIPFSGEQAGQPIPFVKPDERVAGWAADGNSIYVADESGIPAKVYLMDLKTGQRKLHHENAPADLSGVPGVGGGEITPDGSFYVYDVPRTLSYLYVVEGLK
ncbi:MAG TPA: protein kinase [Terriglobales bacterium]|jgi:Tol biopolymer transport system component|nr:protein kinase [Terriglobales bacterium]